MRLLENPRAGTVLLTWMEPIGLISALGVAVWIYRAAFQGFFVQDDFGWLESSRFRSLSEYIRIFFRFNPALCYRPLSQETYFFLAQKVFGLWPPGFHLVSLSWHLLASALVYLLLRQFYSILPCLVGTLFFAAHGAHFASVYWISALPEPMALGFYLAALVLFIQFDRSQDHRAYAASVGAMILGLMSKESILTLPLVLAAYCLLFAPRRLLWTSPHFALTGLYALLRAISRMVNIAPYPLNFGREAWHNLLVYLSWTAGFTDTFIKTALERDLERSYLWTAACFVLAVVLLCIYSRNRRVTVFSLFWYIIALQPVLYFSGHIYSYYLGTALPATALLMASALPPAGGHPAWKAWVPALALLYYCLWFPSASVRREGRWWNERSFVGRNILARMPAVDNQVPDGRQAYLFGFGQWELGILQNDSAFKAFGFSPKRFILVDLDSRHWMEIMRLKNSGGLRDYYCFVYTRGNFINITTEFQEDPERLLCGKPENTADSVGFQFQERPEVRLEVQSREIRAGQDTLEFRVINFDVHAIDLLYSIDSNSMPPVYGWRLDENRKARVFVDQTTPKGVYLFKAIRDSRYPCRVGWIRVDVEVLVK